MRIALIGGTGHIGTYLAPRLVRAGHEVLCLSRGNRQPYRAAMEWNSVRMIPADRKAEDKAGTFGKTVAALKPDAVIDLICFNAPSAKLLVDALRGQVQHFLSCGTIWVHGPAEVVPTPEEAPRRPVGEYGIEKNRLEQYLFSETRLRQFPATVVHPGHIVGPGWKILNPQGNFGYAAWQTLADGKELILPNLGLECVHHVHADDVAQCFERALARPSASIGESFHAVSPQALTLYGYATAAARWFGHEAKLRFVPSVELAKHIDPTDAEHTIDHILRSPCMSIAKGRRLIGYEPRYSSLEACREAADWLIAKGEIKVSK
ncbi:MAG TPA: NAD-dependent epimerase/dehydratase family protein [Planctomycetota bacterium]|nr:NAD-dependent epimerase/dehydratase family protein [Planctomycetota bacterium]